VFSTWLLSFQYQLKVNSIWHFFLMLKRLKYHFQDKPNFLILFLNFKWFRNSNGASNLILFHILFFKWLQCFNLILNSACSLIFCAINISRQILNFSAIFYLNFGIQMVVIFQDMLKKSAQFLISFCFSNCYKYFTHICRFSSISYTFLFLLLEMFQGKTSYSANFRVFPDFCHYISHILDTLETHMLLICKVQLKLICQIPKKNSIV
jgi:hypothetical protein